MHERGIWIGVIWIKLADWRLYDWVLDCYLCYTMNLDISHISLPYRLITETKICRCGWIGVLLRSGGCVLVDSLRGRP